MQLRLKELREDLCLSVTITKVRLSSGLKPKDT
nr:MAG TPA: hypothetical protein [Caudoviricetes sp.]